MSISQNDIIRQMDSTAYRDSYNARGKKKEVMVPQYAPVAQLDRAPDF